MSLFRKKVLAIVRQIPLGRVMTYASVAAAAESKGAHRAVGTILKGNTEQEIPCHRVIRSDGAIGEYNGLQGMKAELLRCEGVFISSRGFVKIKVYLVYEVISYNKGKRGKSGANARNEERV